MGDAVAVALMECRGFTSKDFAKYHPGGALGKKLYVTIGDLLDADSKPLVAPSTPVKDVIIEISKGRVGAVAVMKKDALLGIVTDGDIRRMLERGADLKKITAEQIMGKNPKIVEASALAVEGFHMMESNSITQLIVMQKNKFKGIVHLHDILKEGIF